MSATPRLEDGMAVLTVYFTNQGQDFLEFDISKGLIVAARPTASQSWRHFRIITPENEIKPGVQLKLRNRENAEAPVLTLKHPLWKVERHWHM